MTDQIFSNSYQTGMFSQRISRLVPPPRRVPLPAVCAILTGRLGLVGANFFTFGVIYVWLFGPMIHPIDEWRLSRSYAEAPALIESVQVTNPIENITKVYEYHFRFQPGDGMAMSGSYYTTEQTWKEGDRVVVHYLPGKPEVACLEGARISVFSPWIVLLLFIFPTVGLSIIITALVSGVKKIKLLRFGEVTGSINISSSPTNVSVNNVPVLKYSYEFRDRLGGLYTGASKARSTENIGDELSEPILYLPSNPRQSMLVDALSLKYPLEVDEEGNWYHRWPAKPLLIFLLLFLLALILIDAVINFFIFSSLDAV